MILREKDVEGDRLSIEDVTLRTEAAPNMFGGCGDEFDREQTDSHSSSWDGLRTPLLAQLEPEIAAVHDAICGHIHVLLHAQVYS